MLGDGSSLFRRKSARRYAKSFKACPRKNDEPIDANFVANTAARKVSRGLTIRNNGPSKHPSLRVQPQVNEIKQTSSLERRCVGQSFLLSHRGNGRDRLDHESDRISGALKAERQCRCAAP